MSTKNTFMAVITCSILTCLIYLSDASFNTNLSLRQRCVEKQLNILKTDLFRFLQINFKRNQQNQFEHLIYNLLSKEFRI